MAITSVDSEYLVGLHRAGDGEAFATIVRTHYRRLFRRASQRLHDDDAAEDAVQESLLRAYRALPRFGARGEWYLTAWLYRILDNVCTDELHRRRRSDDAIERLAAHRQEEEPSVDATSQLPEIDLVGAVAMLPAGYREALVLREVDGLSYAEVAEAAGITEDNARARVSRARSALRRMIAPTVAVYAWVAGIARRGRVPGSGTSSASVTASTAASAPVNLSAATDLIVQVTAMAPEHQMSTAMRVAAAVVAVALPVGGVAASNQSTAPRGAAQAPAAARATAGVVETPVDRLTVDAGASLVATGAGAGMEGVVLVPAGEGASSTASSSTTSSSTSTTTSTTSTTAPGVAPTVAGGDAEVDDADDAGGAGDGREGTDHDAPTDQRELTMEPALVERRTLHDGRVELTASFEIQGREGAVPVELRLVAELPENDCGVSCRLTGALLLLGEREGRIRITGDLEAVTGDDDGSRTYVFTGRFSSTDADDVDLPPRGAAKIVFGSAAGDPLSVRLAAGD